MKDIKVGETSTFQGYPIVREAEDEYCVKIYADDMKTAQEVVSRCLKEGIIEWPVETAGRRKKQTNIKVR